MAVAKLEEEIHGVDEVESLDEHDELDGVD